MRKKKDKILVICVDRDNDVGEKTKFKGPLLGREKILEAANQLGLEDPQDSDFNTMFQAVRVYEETKKQYDSQCVVITGHSNVGVQSDKEISKQLEWVLNHFKATYCVLVTDGAEDEHIMPIIQSRLPILSVDRVIIRQAQQLESSYYKVKDFIEETLENPKMARLVFGLPAIALLLYGLFGWEGWRIILGVVGAYLLIKGFRLEGMLFSAYDEMRTSLTRRRFAFFMYVVSICFGVLGIYRGYMTIMSAELGIFQLVSTFISASIYFFFLCGALAWLGRAVNREKKRRKFLSVPIFGFAVSLVIHSVADLLLQQTVPIFNFLAALIFSFFLMGVALVIEWKRLV